MSFGSRPSSVILPFWVGSRALGMLCQKRFRVRFDAFQSRSGGTIGSRSLGGSVS